MTADKTLPYQQNPATLPIACVVLDSFSNELPALLPLIPNLEQALVTLIPKTYVLVKRENDV